jgi:hypothetical protein
MSRYDNFLSSIKKKKVSLIIAFNGVIFVLSQKEDLIKAYDLFLLLEFVAILEALKIILKIAKQFGQDVLHLVF